MLYYIYLASFASVLSSQNFQVKYSYEKYGKLLLIAKRKRNLNIYLFLWLLSYCKRLLTGNYGIKLKILPNTGAGKLAVIPRGLATSDLLYPLFFFPSSFISSFSYSSYLASLPPHPCSIRPSSTCETP